MLTKPWLCAISLPVSPACDSQGLARDRPGAPRVCALEELGIEPQKPTPKGILARSGHQVCLAGHKGNLADDVTLSRTLRSLRVFTMEPIIVTNRESVVLLGLTEARDLKGLKDRRPCYPSWPHLSITEIGAAYSFGVKAKRLADMEMTRRSLHPGASRSTLWARHLEGITRLQDLDMMVP